MFEEAQGKMKLQQTNKFPSVSFSPSLLFVSSVSLCLFFLPQLPNVFPLISSTFLPFSVRLCSFRSSLSFSLSLSLARAVSFFQTTAHNFIVYLFDQSARLRQPLRLES